MKTLWFVVPVHGRLELTRICLRQLRRTCDAIREEGVNASAVVVSDRDTLDELDISGLGFGWVVRDNDYTSAKFNDGIQLATDPRYNPAPADYVVPCGSDDWLDHRLFLEPLPAPDTIQGFQWMSFVPEDGREISKMQIRYEGGTGIRIIPRELVAFLGYRPAHEDIRRGCDTSILSNLGREHGDHMKVTHWHLHDRQIVDWKTPQMQLNAYRNIECYRTGADPDPFGVLAEFYPAEALDEMRSLYTEWVAA